MSVGGIQGVRQVMDHLGCLCYYVRVQSDADDLIVFLPSTLSKLTDKDTRRQNWIAQQEWHRGLTTTEM